jgi:hypothetical protein
MKFNRVLKSYEIDFKVSRLQNYNGQVYAFLLAYKDARVDMGVLDQVATPMGWQCEYQRDTKGVLQCGIGVFDTDQSQWVWKWSNGTPSEFEGVKGEYSDAFKRAGFMWGIGRHLYDFPTLKVILEDKEYSEKDGKLKATGFLKPNEWNWYVEYGNGEDLEDSIPLKIRAEKKYGTTWRDRVNIDNSGR